MSSTNFSYLKKANTFYVGSKSIDAKSFQLDDGSYLGRFARFSSYTYCLDLSNDKKSIAVGSGFVY